MPLAQFKLKKANASTKIVTFAEPPSWEHLASKITDIPRDQVSLAFVDKDEDAITVNNEEDLQDFYKSSYRASEVNKFVVQNLSVPDRACAFDVSFVSPVVPCQQL